ncbi:MAG: D-alanine--D-alanine ligase [Acidobacteriota bacterium]
MNALRVLALMHDYLVPPDDTEGLDVVNVPWKMEFDVVSHLEGMGHRVRKIGVKDDLGVVRQAILDFKPQIVFNLMENFREIGVFDQHVVSFLELMRTPYTGCNPRGLMLSRDKALARTLLAAHRIPAPDFAVVRMGQKPRLQKKLQFPLIVKSLTQEASIGISQASVVEDEASLGERVAFVHQNVGTDAIIERYVDGRELYVGIIGNLRLRVFPVWEMNFSQMPDRAYKIASERVKWNDAYREKYGIVTGPADLPLDLTQRITHVCKRVFRTLDLSGYARVDLRLDGEGRFHVLEANPNPQLAYGEDFAEAAEHAGIEYEELLQRILGLGLRWRPGLAG